MGTKRWNRNFSKCLERKQLSERIYNRLDGQISKGLIQDSIMYISMYIVDRLLNNESVRVPNFGSFAVCKMNSKLSGPYLNVRFTQDKIVNKILKEKKDE